jgi:hypothetical protein
MQIAVTQRCQEISGVVSRRRERSLRQSAHLHGSEIRFAVIDATRRPSEPPQFFRRVYGDAAQGSTGRRWRPEKRTVGVSKRRVQ